MTMKRSGTSSLLLVLGVVFTTCFTGTSTNANPNQDSVSASPPQADAQSYFPETGQTVEGAFLSYWEANGGLAQFGYPVSGNVTERSGVDGNEYSMQYFERAVFEYHPEHKGTPYEVLLSLLGASAYKQKYPDGNGAPGQKPSTDHPFRFEQTGKTLGGVFRSYWETHGGLARQGYPLSDEFQETSPLDGKTYTMQYFERAVFEYHPEHKGTPYEVLLSLLGSSAYKADKQGNNRSEAGSSLTLPPIADYRVRHYPVGSDRYLLWVEQSTGPRNPWDDQVSPVLNDTSDIMGMDLKTGASITATDAPCDQDFVAISGSIAVWETVNLPRDPSSYRPCHQDSTHLDPTWNKDVVGKDLDTGITYDIATGPNNQRFPAISGKTVVWLETDSTSTKLLAKDLDRDQVTEIRSGRPDTLTRPVISENYIVWCDPSQANRGTGAGSPQIQAYNRKSGTIKTIAPCETPAPAPSTAIEGSHLVIADYVRTLRIVDLDSGEIRTIDSPGASNVVIRNGYVLWAANRQGGLRGDDIYGTTLKEDKVAPLVINKGNSASPTIAGKWLVWDHFISPSVTDLKSMPLADAFASAP
jgi:hypothetical protein